LSNATSTIQTSALVSINEVNLRGARLVDVSGFNFRCGTFIYRYVKNWRWSALTRL